jgi:hypothetical protein
MLVHQRARRPTIPDEQRAIGLAVEGTAAPHARRANKRVRLGAPRRMLWPLHRFVVVAPRRGRSVRGFLQRPAVCVPDWVHVCLERDLVNHGFACAIVVDEQPRWNRHRQPRNVVAEDRPLLKYAQLDHARKLCAVNTKPKATKFTRHSKDSKK